jgi:hypothetical protein
VFSLSVAPFAIAFDLAFALASSLSCRFDICCASFSRRCASCHKEQAADENFSSFFACLTLLSAISTGRQSLQVYLDRPCSQL